jgi:hypothetical protein
VPRIEEMGFPLEHEPHPSSECRVSVWYGDAQARMDEATTVAELDRIWRRLEREGKVDAWGGAEYRHALSHLYWVSPGEKPPG